MADLFISCSLEDKARVAEFVRLLEDYGWVVFWDHEIRAGTVWARELENELNSARVCVALWTTASIASRWVRIEAYEALQNEKLVPVLLDNVRPPLEFRQTQTFDLTGWSGDRNDVRLTGLLADLASLVKAPVSHEDAQRPSKLVVPETLPDATPAADTWDASSEPYASEFFSPSTITPSAPLGAEKPEPVLLGASAPRHCQVGKRFTAALVAYIEAARASAREKLEALGEPDDRVVMDVAPQHDASWQIGAPVTVRLTGEGVDVMPGEVRFEWNGRENLAAFAARVHDDAPATVVLCFEVFVADVPIAYIPMRLNVAAQAAPLSVQQAQASVPNSVFASYSSKDAQPVTQRLSTLQRWSPGLDIFQDCLDLQLNKSFKPQIKEQISRRDVFLLFWSRNAAASRWVKWEYKTARDTRGLNAILPMPLEDPAIAPPPTELADRHLRDRFMLAGYGLAKVRDEANCPPRV